MIVLDTNVVSTLMRREPDASVLKWLSARADERFSVAAVSLTEIVRGIERLPASARRRDLAAQLERLVDPQEGLLVHPLTDEAARVAGMFMAVREAAGRPVSAVDMMIAGVAHSVGAPLATRNTRDFDGVGLTLINPWDA